MSDITDRITAALKKLRRLAVDIRKKELASKKHKRDFVRRVAEGDNS